MIPKLRETALQKVIGSDSFSGRFKGIDMYRTLISCVTLTLIGLGGCVSNPQPTGGDDVTRLLQAEDRFGARPHIPTVSEVHGLTPAQQQHFIDYYLHPLRRNVAAHQRVFDYLDTMTEGFSYRGDTYTASQALERGAGNCLSLAILTTALAELAGVELTYQLVDATPVFELNGSVTKRSVHVRSRLLDPEWADRDGFLELVRPGIVVDYFPSQYDRFVGNIDSSEYFAMYYRNIAAEALAEGDLSHAYWFLVHSLELSPNDAESIAMLALVFDRAGAQQASENAYRWGTRVADVSPTMLRNYGRFLRRQGRFDEAAEIEAQLVSLEDHNPFDWIAAARSAYGEEDYRAAIRLFKKSIEIAPYLHEGHFGLSRAYLQIGRYDEAEESLSKALNNAYRASLRETYNAKLKALSRIRSSDADL